MLTAGPRAEDHAPATEEHAPATARSAALGPEAASPSALREDCGASPRPALSARPSPKAQPETVERAAREVERGTPQRRPCVSPYVPPQARQRRTEDACWERERAELRRRLEEEDAASKAASAPARPAGPSMRALYRAWEPILEQLGPCCFNPLQRDEGVEIDVREGIRAKAAARDESSPSFGPGIKGLPVVAGGSYHYEVELLRDSALVVGWSAATSFPTGFDAMSFGYSSIGTLVSNHDSESTGYGVPFGKTGDVVGAMIEWPDSGGGPIISFMLNGHALGVAYDVESDEETRGHPPLQLHVCQMTGPSFQVLLRGASPSAPLRYPCRGFTALGEIDEAHFRPFSDAVAHAADYRALAAFDARNLQDFQVPDSHILQLSLDGAVAERAERAEQVELAELVERELAAGVARLMGLHERSAARAFCVRLAAPCTVLVSFRSRAQAARCAEALGSAALPLSGAAPASRRLLAEWRGADFRAPRAPTVARRLIHSCLGLQPPLSFLAQEKDEKSMEARRSGQRHSLSPEDGTELATTATPSTRSRSSSSAEFAEASA